MKSALARWLPRLRGRLETDDGDAAEIARIYAAAAATELTERNPIVFIPGIMGSRLIDPQSAQSVWGDFSRLYADPSRGSNRRLIALPMEIGRPLDELASSAEADGALGEARLRRIPVSVAAYRDILQSVGVGSASERARHRPEYGGGGSFAAFEFGYDWRRSLDEVAQRLGEFLSLATYFVRAVRGDATPVKFDVVAHSMGGLVLRYFLRYGGQRIPYDGSLPRLTWAGSERIERAVIIGTPNAGSTFAISRLVEGLTAIPLVHPGFDPQIVGTMPATYQLLPRTRHAAFVDAADRPQDLFDPEFWAAMRWGLADDRADDLLALQLEGVDTPTKRRDVARDHLAKCLLNAKTFHAALDLPAAPPAPLELHLVAGDAHRTAATVTGTAGVPRVEVLARAAGDGTVLRSSAILDERINGDWRQHVRSPIHWSSIMFAASDHMQLTRDRIVVDNVLFRLLEDPRAAERPG